jgi:predicted Rossmann fold nucleotide-binding protein DprA/Smf involved in DNA uptake
VLQGQLAPSANALLEHKIGRLLAQYARACNRNAAAADNASAGAQLHLLSCLFDRFTANHATYQPTPRLDFAGAHQHGSVQVNELVEQMGVSAVTIRSDLSALESQGLATRSHGGAALARTPPTEHTVPQKDAINHEQKSHRRLRAHGAAGR